MAVGIYGIISNNPNITQYIGIQTQTNGTSQAQATPDYTTKIDNISRNANTVLNDSYTVLEKYANGAIDQDTAISRLQKDKTSLNNALTEIQGLTPPQNLQTFHNLVVSGFQDLNQALSLEISGLQKNDANSIQSAADLIDSAISKFKQAEQETNKTS